MKIISRRRIIETVGAVIGAGPMLAAARHAGAQNVGAFQIGVMPNVSARIILTNYRPMREYLAEKLGRTVEIATATDLREFQRRTLEGAYDLVFTAANLALVAEEDGKLAVLGGFEPPIPALFVTRKDTPAPSPEALRGKALALANPQSLVAMSAKANLAAAGLRADVDYRTIWARNEDSLAQLLSGGEAPIAAMSMGEFRVLRDQIRQTLEFREFARVPNFIALAGKPMAPEALGQLRAMLGGFAETDLGREFQTLTGVQRIRGVPDADRAAIAPVLAETRAALR
jgi:phosphonate transport system substrate-binding protein